MALIALLKCLFVVVALSISSVFEVLAFDPLQPQDKQGFKIPLAVATIQKQDTSSRGIENIATVDVYDTRDLWVKLFNCRTAMFWLNEGMCAAHILCRYRGQP
jgi:hypothetical protein